MKDVVDPEEQSGGLVLLWRERERDKGTCSVINIKNILLMWLSPFIEREIRACAP